MEVKTMEPSLEIINYQKSSFSSLQVDYATIFVFRSLMFIDSGLSAGLRL